jgi:hypothetical protein
MDLRSPVNIVTKHEVFPNLIYDYWFTDTALLARIREKMVNYTGGAFSKMIFRYRPMIVSSYRMGATHDITKVKTLGDANFDLRFAQCSIPEFKEELQVYAKGPEAMFSLLDEDLENGLASLTTYFAIMLWGEGQTDDSLVNGFAEGIGDGVLPSWNGFVATTYGGASRTDGTYGSVLNGNIWWGGNPDVSVAGLSYRKLNDLYTSCKHGRIEPDLIVMNKYAYAMGEEMLEPQYRFNSNERDPYWGGSGWRFKNAIVVVDEYAPSLRNGLSDADNFGLGSYLTASFANPLSGTPRNNFPNSTQATNLTPGEVIFCLNTDYWAFRISDDPEYAFGFSGFMGVPDSEKVVGRIKVAANMHGFGGKYQGLMYGIG